MSTRPRRGWAVAGARGLIRAYQLTLSGLAGRQCRYLPTCSAYADEAIACHGLWPGGWMGVARLCRCHPLGGAGFDPVPQALAVAATPMTPWRYGAWRVPPPATREGEGPPSSLRGTRPLQERASSSAANP